MAPLPHLSINLTPQREADVNVEWEGLPWMTAVKLLTEICDQHRV